MKTLQEISAIFKKSNKTNRFYKTLNEIYSLSILSLFFNFYSDIDKYGDGLAINIFQGELSIIGINILVIQAIMIYYNIDKKNIDKKFNFLKVVPLNLFNLIGLTICLYLIFLYFFITQSNAFGVNPLYKTYGFGFYAFISLQLVCLYKMINRKK